MKYDPDTSAVHVWLVLWKAAHSVETRARRNIESLGLGLSEFMGLELLLHKGPLPVNTIGAKVLLTSGSMTAAIDRLEKRGLVSRGSDPGDRRTRIVHLTAPGRKLITAAFASHARAMEEVMSCLPLKDRKTLLRISKRLGKTAAADHQ